MKSEYSTGLYCTAFEYIESSNLKDSVQSVSYGFPALVTSYSFVTMVCYFLNFLAGPRLE